MWICHTLFAHSSIIRYLCLLLIITSSAAMNIGIQITRWESLLSVLLDCPEVWLLDDMVTFLIFWEIAVQVFHSTDTIFSFPLAVHRSYFGNSHPNRCEVESHCSLDLHFFNVFFFVCVLIGHFHIFRDFFSFFLSVFLRGFYWAA